MFHIFCYIVFLAACVIALSEVVVACYAVIKGERDLDLQLRR